jgi:voltage-gated potassium channel
MVKGELEAWGHTPRHRRSAARDARRRLVRTLIAFLLVVLFGFVGYQVLEGLGPLDSLYMTVITITTVGFREVVELDDAGKMLTIALIGAGVVTVTYAAFTAAEYVVEGHLRDELERRRMDRAISELRHHTIVCGYGRVGRHLAATLERDGAPFVVVDNDEDKLDELADRGHLRVRGDATEEHVLAEAGLDHAAALVACVNSDADNVLVTLTAKGMRPGCVVIARVKADENERKLQRAGADRVISPSTIGGRRIAQILTRPAVADFLDGIAGGATDYTLEEVTVAAGGELDGLSLRDAAIRERFHCTVLALRHAADNRLDSHPAPNQPLEVGDVLVVMGSEDDVVALRHHYVG